MTSRRISFVAGAGQLVEPVPSGTRAVYLVETRSRAEAIEIGKLFEELGTRILVRQLSEGRLVSYVAQADPSDPSILDEIEEVLKANYAFVVTQASFDEVIYRIVGELCTDTGSKRLSVDCCDICGKAEPFPTTAVTLADCDGNVLESRSYCGGCAVRAAAPRRIRKNVLRGVRALSRR